MGKLSAGFDLGTELRTHRKAAGLTQPNLATKAGLAERTIRALELGSGTLNSWNVALDALELSLSGRNLPGGTTLGERLTTLRRRRGLSREELARSVGVTRPTLGALEREGKGRLSTLQRVLTVLGAGAYLAPHGQRTLNYPCFQGADAPSASSDAKFLRRQLPKTLDLKQFNVRWPWGAR